MKKTSKIYLLLILVIFLVVSSFVYLYKTKNKAYNPNSAALSSQNINGVNDLEKQKNIEKNITEKIKKIQEKDKDLDGLTDEEEKKYGTDPENIDSDGDGLLDAEEVTVYHTNPLDPDTDKDGVKDGREVELGRDPLKKDK
jgi:hypothetical protein